MRATLKRPAREVQFTGESDCQWEQDPAQAQLEGVSVAACGRQPCVLVFAASYRYHGVLHTGRTR